MKGEDIYSAMDGIKDDILVRSEKNKGRLKKKKWIWPAVAGIAVAAILAIVVLINGNKKVLASNLMEGIVPSGDMKVATALEYAPALTDFSIRFFKECYMDGTNQLVSPLSAIYALGMTANGADGETLRQMENAFGISSETMNRYLYSYISNLSRGENYKLGLANSIWVEEGLKNVKNDFLQTNADYYNADIYRLPFDESAVNTVNSWVNDKTDGMIPAIIDELSPEDVMILINALCFDARWEEPYDERAVRDDVFQREDKSMSTVPFMFSTEKKYIEDEYATGFIKPYAYGKYAFVALLPNEGVSVKDYVSSLNGQKVLEMLNSASNEEVRTKMPKFKAEYTIPLTDALKRMGITDAFGSSADFTRMASKEDALLYISRVIQKTYIEVDEKGTKAAAVTAVLMGDGGTGTAPIQDYKTVYLDRPFVYMLIDCRSNVPFFIGTLMDVPKH